MKTLPSPAFAPRSSCWAIAFALVVGAADAGAQDRPVRGAHETRIDQFVTTQDGAVGFGSAAPQDEDAGRLSDVDRAFLSQAHQLELLHVHASAVALKRRTPQAVQSHARRVLAAHQPGLVAIEKIAREHGQELERRFTPDFERRAEALGQADRSSFGPVYFGQMLDLHARTVMLYEDASSTVQNADLRSLVEDSLPTLRTQLADAEQFSTALATR